MTRVFADTYFFLAILNEKDDSRARALALANSLRCPMTTTAWVLAELADGLADTAGRVLFAPFVARLKSDPRSSVIPPSETLFDRGIELYTSRPDQQWSLTDCISFVVMTDLGISDALTGDHHFEQAGFRALLKA